MSINLNQNSILTHPRPMPDVRLEHTSSGSPHAAEQGATEGFL